VPATAQVVESRNAERAVLAGTAHREFVHVGFANWNAACVDNALHRRRCVRRDPILENLRTARRARAGQAHVVFDCDRNARKRKLLAALHALVNTPRRVASQIVQARQIRPDAFVHGIDMRERCIRYFARRKFAAVNRARDLGRAHPNKVRH
jgi:hypothetical protein